MLITRNNIQDYMKSLNDGVVNLYNKFLERSKLLSYKDWLYDLKFNKTYLDPLLGVAQNFGEILDQSFTYYVSFKAAEDLFKTYTWINFFTMNIGSSNGIDIESNTSINGDVVLAEVFAVVKPSNNKKLNKEIKNIKERIPSQQKVTNILRYIYFHCPDESKYASKQI